MKCKKCGKQYGWYCDNDECPVYIELVNKNFKEFMTKVRQDKQVYIKRIKKLNIPEYFFDKERLKEARLYLKKWFGREATVAEINAYIEKQEVKKIGFTL